MAFRFFRRLRIAPGITLNLSKSGGSFSLGRRGAHYTVGPRGTRSTVGIPGTGLFYTKTSSHKRRGRGRSRASSLPKVPPQDKLTLGFFKRLFTPHEEKTLVDGCRELALGRENAALKHLQHATHLADGAFLAGVLTLKKKQFQLATPYLKKALGNKKNLGRYFRKYGISATISLPISDEVTAHVGSNVHGVLLALVEAYQGQDRWHDAADCLKRLRRLEPQDEVVKLSLVELLLDANARNRKTLRYVVQLCEGVKNESAVHAAILLYKAKALRALGLDEAARSVLTLALRRRKNRSEELMDTIRYERALTYEALGQRRRAKSDLERIYAENPNYEDVANRLGLL